jgi:phage terminase large subunit-like protein
VARDDLHPAEQYARDILDEKIVSCKWVKLACKRYFDDLEHGAERGIYFDREAAQHRLDFYRFCKHSKGKWAGQILSPEPWQQFIQWNIFGWKVKATGKRRFSTVYVSVPKKNGKSTDLASTGLYLAFFDDEEGAEVYTAATKYDQAIIIHGESTSMVQRSEPLRRMIKVSKNNLIIEAKRQIYRPLGQDATSEDGKNVHGALIDEYHEHPTDGMYTILKSGMVSREQPMMFIITTAGFEKQYPCFEFEQRAKRIIDGSEIDDSFFSVVYSIDEGDDWTDPDMWIKANPNMGVSKFMDRLIPEFKEAQSIARQQNNFQTKHLNIWTEAQTRWITADQWNLNNYPVDEEGLFGRTCFAGIDLSSNQDLSAYVLCFPPNIPGDKYKFLYRFFLPQDGMREREVKEKVNYSVWVRDGFITTTPGDCIDYSFIKAKIFEDAQKYSISEIAFDPFRSRELTTALMAEGLNCIEMRQGHQTMGPASAEFELKVLRGELATGGNPVMKWMIACTELIFDSNANFRPVKPDRQQTGKHIDGVVASIMAFGRAVMSVEQGASIYETEELLIL